MALNGVMALILRYFTEFGIASGAAGALRKSGWRCRRKKSSRSLSHLLMSFLYYFLRRCAKCAEPCEYSHNDIGLAKNIPSENVKAYTIWVELTSWNYMCALCRGQGVINWTSWSTCWHGMRELPLTQGRCKLQREQTGRQVLWIDVQYPETRFLETKQAMMLAMYNSVWTV